MSHADYFTTHFSLLAPFFERIDHGLSRLPRIFFAFWVPLAQLFLAIGFAQTALNFASQVRARRAHPRHSDQCSAPLDMGRSRVWGCFCWCRCA